MIIPETLGIPLGIVGAIVGISLYLPQIYKAWKTKHTKDISLGTYFLILVSDVTWSCYGMAYNIPLIYVTNMISTGLSITILLQKRRYDGLQRIPHEQI